MRFSFGGAKSNAKNRDFIRGRQVPEMLTLGLWTAARLGEKSTKFDVILYQFPDHLERTFYIFGQLVHRGKTMVSVVFCHLLTFSVWVRPKRVGVNF
jgi:hypothetical protein